MADNALYQPRIDGEMRATQPRNALLGLLADALYAADKYAQRPNPSMPMGKANPPLSLLSSALGLGDIAATADRYNMRQDITRGSGWATQMLPETANALLSVGPAVAKYPKQAAVAMGLLSGDTSAAMKAATVWHGSPHKFDKFDSSKIGTGEGAQAYGHGLYLAESPEVAGQYQKTLAADGFLVGGKVFDPSSLAHMNVRSIARSGDLDGAIAKAQAIAASDSPVSKLAAQDFARLQEIKAAGGLQQNTGSLYKVDLPDSAISRMLDWDKPLSQQPRWMVDALDEAQYRQMEDAAQKLGMTFDQFERTASRSQYPPTPAGTGEEFVRSLSNFLGGPAKASTYLQANGIPGIRYLDGGSRGAGAGTSNFVVFPGEEGLLSILERNGVPVK